MAAPLPPQALGVLCFFLPCRLSVWVALQVSFSIEMHLGRCAFPHLKITCNLWYVPTYWENLSLHPESP